MSAPDAEKSGDASKAPPTKRCPKCKLPTRLTAVRCSCGYVFGSDLQAEFQPVAFGSPAQEDIRKRPGIITLLALLQFFGGALMLLASLLILFAGLAEDSPDGFPMLVGGALFVVWSVVSLIGAYGLWTLKSYGRIIQLVFSWIGLIGFPVGTLISILILFYLYKPGIKVLFSGKPASNYSPDEVVHVRAVTEGSVGVVIAVVVGVFLAVIMLGIVAAIAIPGLLRARISANEATAISALREITAAQAHYYRLCGGYASNLPELKRTELLPAEFTNAETFSRNGYSFTVERPEDARVARKPGAGCNEPVSDYVVRAHPINEGSTGIRYFAAGGPATIYFSDSPLTHPIAQSGIPIE